MFHLAAVFEESDVVGGRLDAQDEPQLVVHLDRHPTHMVLDAGALDAGVKVVADLGLHVSSELMAQERRHVVRLDSVDRRARQDLVQRSEVSLALEDDVGGVFDLHQAPVVARFELLDDGAVDARPAVQLPVQCANNQLLGQFLSSREILDLDEGVVGESKADPSLAQLGRQVVMAIEVELEPERYPGRHTQVAQPKPLIDEVEVVVQTLRVPVPERQLARLLVVPGPVGRTGFHRREDMDQAGMLAPLTKDLLDPAFLAEIALPFDVLDLQAVLLGQALGVTPNLFAQGLGELGEVEDTDLASPQLCAHRVGIANLGNRACNDYPVEARQSPADLVGVPFRQQLRHDSLLQGREMAPSLILSCRGASTSMVPAMPG